MSDYYRVKRNDKVFHLIRTESGRWFDISNCQALTDAEIPNRDGLIPNAQLVPAEVVAELVAKSLKAKAKSKSEIRRLGIEEVDE